MNKDDCSMCFAALLWNPLDIPSPRHRQKEKPETLRFAQGDT